MHCKIDAKSDNNFRCLFPTSISKDGWHPFEDAALTEGVRKHGNRFAKILEENPYVLQVTM